MARGIVCYARAVANRSYLYSISNRPTSYVDRPETIHGLAEWAYDVPLSFQVLMSGNPQLCASLVADGLEDEPEGAKSKLYALSAEFEPGYARLRRLAAALRFAAEGRAPALLEALVEMLSFLEQHRDRYLLLETIELDMMMVEGEGPLRESVEHCLAACLQVGAAVDALPNDPALAAAALRQAASPRSTKPWYAPWRKEPPPGPFSGIVLTDDFDNVRDNKTARPLGLSDWSSGLYYELWNRERFEAERGAPP